MLGPSVTTLGLALGFIGVRHGGCGKDSKILLERLVQCSKAVYGNVAAKDVERKVKRSVDIVSYIRLVRWELSSTNPPSPHIC
jgi:hypothetical protein